MQSDGILNMATGAILERADYEMSKIIDNILDPNTAAAKKRVLTITVEFTPNADRDRISISAVSKSKLEPTNAVTTSLYLTKDENGDTCAVEMVPQVPGQIGVYTPDQEEPKIFRIAR